MQPSRTDGISPSNRRYLDKELYDFLEGLMRPTSTTYLSPHEELIRNEVVKEQLRVFKACVGKRK